jgi:cation diffusion facilitator family transporter
LIGGSLGIGYHSYELLWQVEQTLEHAMHPAALFFAGSSILVKEWLYRITKNIGEETRSDVLVANAWHHRSDAFSSIVAFGGILGTIIGFPVLDPIGGIIVAGMILQSGGSITANAFKELVDARVDDPVIQGVQKILDELMAESKLSIKDVLQIRARKMGPYTLVDMYVSVPPRLSISTGHQIAEHIRHEILHELPVVTEVMVHIVPEDIEDHLAPPIPMRPHGEVEAEVTKVLLNVPGIRTVSHVLIHHSNGKCIVQAEVSVDMEQSLQSAGDIVLQAEHEASKITGVDSVDLHLELKTHHARA